MLYGIKWQYQCKAAKQRMKQQQIEIEAKGKEDLKSCGWIYGWYVFSRKLTINSGSSSTNRTVTSIFIVSKSLSDSISKGLIFKNFLRHATDPLRWHALHANVLHTLYIMFVICLRPLNPFGSPVCVCVCVCARCTSMRTKIYLVFHYTSLLHPQHDYKILVH